jgi:hypothetical protein
VSRVLAVLAVAVALAGSIVAAGARAGLLAGPAAGSTGPADTGAEVSLLYRGAVTVGADGNGVVAATFATTLSGPLVRYVLVVENGQAPVGAVTVTLNGDVVLDRKEAFAEVRKDVVLNPIGADDNTLVVAAHGSAQSSARVAVLAVRSEEQMSVLYRGAVTVGADGNGVVAATFATTFSGPLVRYVLVVENGRAPVRAVTVTLNGDVVLDAESPSAEVRKDVALNPVGGDDNALVVAAHGFPHTSARFAVLAVREPDTPCDPPQRATAAGVVPLRMAQMNMQFLALQEATQMESRR